MGSSHHLKWSLLSFSISSPSIPLTRYCLHCPKRIWELQKYSPSSPTFLSSCTFCSWMKLRKSFLGSWSRLRSNKIFSGADLVSRPDLLSSVVETPVGSHGKKQVAQFQVLRRALIMPPSISLRPGVTYTAFFLTPLAIPCTSITSTSPLFCRRINGKQLSLWSTRSTPKTASETEGAWAYPWYTCLIQTYHGRCSHSVISPLPALKTVTILQLRRGTKTRALRFKVM